MSGVTPIEATGRLVITYNSDLPHRIQLLCNIAFITGSWWIVDRTTANIDPGVAATSYVTLAKPAFATTSTFVGWILERYANGAYVEENSGSLGIAGTASNAAGLANQFTFVFRDANNDTIRNVWLGVQSQIVPVKLGYSQLSGATLAFVNDMLDISSGHLGSLFTGRAGTQPTRFISLVGALNRKARRRLGLA